jgi:uncharacterized protein involved in exopolysaccharide biosynthesis
MTELERELVKSLELLSKQYQADMKVQSEQVSLLQQQVTTLSGQVSKLTGQVESLSVMLIELAES